MVITRITEGGLADRDQRLKYLSCSNVTEMICFLFCDICRLHDIILRVNEMDFTRIEHQAAVDGLKAAGNHVTLVSIHDDRTSLWNIFFSI